MELPFLLSSYCSTHFGAPVAHQAGGGRSCSHQTILFHADTSAQRLTARGATRRGSENVVEFAQSGRDQHGSRRPGLGARQQHHCRAARARRGSGNGAWR